MKIILISILLGATFSTFGQTKKFELSVATATASATIVPPIGISMANNSYTLNTAVSNAIIGQEGTVLQQVFTVNDKFFVSNQNEIQKYIVSPRSAEHFKNECQYTITSFNSVNSIDYFIVEVEESKYQIPVKELKIKLIFYE